MKKLLVFVIILGAVAAYLGLNFHFILFDEKLVILEKDKLSIQSTFVDARGPRLITIIAKPDLIKAGIKNALEGGQGYTIRIPQYN